MTKVFSKASIDQMDANLFRQAIGHVNVFRIHARQMRNDFFGLPADHHETLEDRIDRLATWLWTSPDARTESGKTVQQFLRFVIQSLGANWVWSQTHPVDRFQETTIAG